MQIDLQNVQYRWGETKYGFSSDLKVGRTNSDSYYRGRVKMPPTYGLDIESITLYVQRIDGYATHTLNFYVSSSESWGASADWSANLVVSSGTNVKTLDMSGAASVVGNYQGNWYIHIQHGAGTNSYSEFRGVSSETPWIRIQTRGSGTWYYDPAAGQWFPNITATKAPTSVTATSRVGRGKTATINWSGASGGTSNTITGYRIYYKIGGAPTTANSYWTVTTTATSGSYTTPALSTTQGEVYYFKVMTLGSAGSSYYSPLSGNTPTTRINTTPTLSAFSVNTPVVSSRGTEAVTFSISRSDANGDTIYARFYRVSGSTYTQIGSEVTGASMSMTLSVAQLPENTGGSDVAHTYAVRVADTYDSWTYYAQRTLTITRKAKPTIASLSITAGNSPTYRTLTDNNTLPFCTLVTGSASTGGTIASYQWYIRVSDTLGGLGSASAQGISTASFLNNLNVTPWAKYNQYYQIGLKVNSGYEDSDILWKTSSYTSGGRTSTGFYVAPDVVLIGVSNKHTASNVFNPALETFAGTTATDFADQLSISYTYNSLYTINFFWTKTAGTSSLTLISGPELGGYRKNLSFSPSDGNFNVTTRTNFYFYISTSYGSLPLSYSGSGVRAKIETSPLRNTTLQSGIYSGRVQPIYTNRLSNYTSTFTQFWLSKNLSTYYNMATDWSNFSLWLHVGNASTKILQGSSGNPPTQYSPDTRAWAYTGQDLYNWDVNPLSLSFNTEHNAYLQLRVSDKFLKTYRVDSSTFTLNLREVPLFLAPVNLAMRYNQGSGETIISPGGSTIINEGYALKLTAPTARTYAGTNLTYRYYIAKTTTPLADLSNGAYSLFATGVTSSLQNSTIDFSTTIGTIGSPTYCYFKVEASDPLSQVATAYYTGYTLLFGKLQQISSQNLGTSGGSIETVGANSSVQFNYLLRDAGGGLINSALSYANLHNGQGLIKVEVQYSTDNETFTTYGTRLFDAATHTAMGNAIQAGVRSSTLTLPAVQSAFVYVRLKVSVQVYTGATGVTTPVYTTYSNALAIANAQPPLAIRENFVGVNQRFFESDDAFVVNVADSRDKVRFMSGVNEITFDLVTGEIDGAILDGGSW